MRKIALFVAAVGLLGAGIAAATPKQAQPLTSFDAFQNQGQQNQQQPEMQTFMGTIMKTGDQLVFSDDATQSSYRLDDQKTAQKFEGKKVRVTGLLDAQDNMIRVQSIEAAA